MTWQDGAPTRPRKRLSESQKRQLARMRGEYTDPAPVKTKSISRFCGRIAQRKEEPALRGKSGGVVPDGSRK